MKPRYSRVSIRIYVKEFDEVINILVVINHVKKIRLNPLDADFICNQPSQLGGPSQ